MPNSYLSRTYSGAGNRKTFTISAWIKRSGIHSDAGTGQQDIIACSTASNTFFAVYFASNDDSLVVYEAESGTTKMYIDFANNQNTKLRDSTAWYHIVVAVDTTQGTASNRLKLWVNNVLQTPSNSTYPTQNYDSLFNTAIRHDVGAQGSGFSAGTGAFDGYMSHVVVVDGTALTPSSFGETDSSSGIWVFKSPSGLTFGTNGFHLKFENAGALGTDSSGNNHTFTVNGNLKQSVDTPTISYVTMMKFDYGQQGTTANANASTGNLTVTGTGANWKGMYGAFGVDTGKWYYEAKMNGTTSGSLGYAMGWVDPAFNTDDDINSGTPSHKFYARQGTIFYANNSGTSNYFGATSDGDIYMTAIDLDNNKIWFGLNGTWQNSGGSGSNTTTYSSTTLNPSYPDATGVVVEDGGYKAGVYAPCAFCYGTGASINFNFGTGLFGTTAITSAGSNGNGSLFEYDVPSGFYALNTKNINTYG